MVLSTPSGGTQCHGFFVRQINIGLQQKSNRHKESSIKSKRAASAAL
jgi:hypothetical protein